MDALRDCTVLWPVFVGNFEAELDALSTRTQFGVALLLIWRDASKTPNRQVPVSVTSRKKTYYDRAAQVAEDQRYFTQRELDEYVADVVAQTHARGTGPTPVAPTTSLPGVSPPASLPEVSGAEEELTDTQDDLARVELLLALATPSRRGGAAPPLSPHAKDRPEQPKAPDAVTKLCDSLEALQRDWNGAGGQNVLLLADEEDVPKTTVRTEKLLGVLAQLTDAASEHPEKRLLRQHFDGLFKRVVAAKLGQTRGMDPMTGLRQLFDADVWSWMPYADHGEVLLVDTVQLVPEEGLSARLEVLRELLAASMPLSSQALHGRDPPDNVWAATAVTHAAVAYSIGLLSQLSRTQYALHADKIGTWTSHDAAEISATSDITISGALYQYLTVYSGLSSAARQLRKSWAAHNPGNKAKREHTQKTARLVVRYLQNVAFAWETLVRAERDVGGRRVVHWHNAFDRPPLSYRDFLAVVYVQTTNRLLGSDQARFAFADSVTLIWSMAQSRAIVESLFEAMRKALALPSSGQAPIPPKRLYAAPANAPAHIVASAPVPAPASAPAPAPIGAGAAAPAPASVPPRIPPASLSMTPGAPPGPGRPEGAPKPGSVNRQDLERGQRQLSELAENIKGKNMTQAVRTAMGIASQSASVVRNHLGEQLAQTLALLPAAGNQHIVKIRNTLQPMISSSSPSSSPSPAQADASSKAAAPTTPATHADRAADPFRW